MVPFCIAGTGLLRPSCGYSLLQRHDNAAFKISVQNKEFDILFLISHGVIVKVIGCTDSWKPLSLSIPYLCADSTALPSPGAF